MGFYLFDIVKKITVPASIPAKVKKIKHVNQKMHRKQKEEKTFYTAKSKNKFEIFSMVSYSERAPSLNEFYGDAGFLLPNSQLIKESFGYL